MTSLIKRKEASDKVQAIKVYPRIRPMSDGERECKAHNVLDTGNTSISLKSSNSVKKYSFDHVFNNTTTQQELYDTVVSPMIFEVLSGFSCTVFAYGQTGTGKTFTMAGGSPEESGWRQDKRAGIIPRALAQLFELLNGREANVRVSYIELYNEEIIDLLSDEDPTSRIRLYDDQKQKGSVIIQGAEEVTVRDKNEVYALLDKGMRKRQTAATLMNASSSRSHTVFIITVHTREVSAEGEEMVKIGKLHLVDLAGSENIAKSGATEKRARETAMINQSLLTLGRVIHALVGNNSHVPYRESKLTRILQDSLGGRSKTSLVITISPASNNLEETINTLEYGSRARNIHNRPEVNQRMSKTLLISSYVEEIEKLKKDLAATRTKDGVFLHADNFERMMEEKKQNADELLNRINQIKAFQERIDLLQIQKVELERNFTLTESARQNSESKLDHCKSDLLKVKKKNKIRDVYIQKVFEIEDRNSNCFAELRDFAYKTYENECFMHNKMEQCYDVFMKNYERGLDALNESEEMKSDLSNNVHNYAQKIDIAIKNNVSLSKQNNEDIQTYISDFRSNINNSHSSINQSQQTILQITDKLLNVSNAHNNVNSDLRVTLSQFLFTLNNNMSTLQEFFTSATDVLMKLRELNDNQNAIAQANSRLFFNDVTLLCNQIVENTQKKFEIRKKGLKIVEEETKANQMLLQDGHKFATDLQERLQLCFNDIERMKSIYTTTLYQCDTQDKALKAFDIKAIEDLDFWKKFAENGQSTIKSSINRGLQSQQQEIQRLNPEYDVLLSEVQKSENLTSQLKELSNTDVEKVVSQNTEVEDDLAQEVNSIVTLIASELKVTNKANDKTIKHTKDLFQKMQPLLESDDMKQTVAEINEMTENFDLSLPKLINRFEQFIKQDMERVKPSGDTPVKAVLQELPGNKKIPTQVLKKLASKIDIYDENHADSYLEQEGINPDISICLDSSLLSQNSLIASDEIVTKNPTVDGKENSVIVLD